MDATEVYYSPYRKDFGESVAALLDEDHDYVTSSLEERDGIFVLAYISVMFLSLIKVIAFTFLWVFKKRALPKCALPLDRHTANNYSEGTSSLELMLRESEGTVTNKYSTTKSADKSTALMELRDYLLTHNFTLHGTILKRIERRVSEEELIRSIRTGEIETPFTRVQVTFGNDMNKVLKKVLGKKITLGTKKFTQETYITIGDSDYSVIKEPLQEMFNRQVFVLLDENWKN